MDYKRGDVLVFRNPTHEIQFIGVVCEPVGPEKLQLMWLYKKYGHPSGAVTSVGLDNILINFGSSVNNTVTCEKNIIELLEKELNE